MASETCNRIRTNFAATDTKRDEGLKTPENIKRFDDISYGPDQTWQVLDVYRPKASGNEKLPVIVSVHGGGWVYGDKERYQYYCMDLALRGFAVVNFTYRLAPENKFPAALEDTCLVFSWVLEHADEYGFDQNAVFAAGDSAGAHTLELFCALCTSEEYRKHFAFAPPQGFVPAAAALNCGVHIVKVSDAPENKFDTDLMQDYLENGGTKEEIILVNPLEWITDNFPPVFLMTAEGDFLKYQVPAAAAKLIEKNVLFKARFYKEPDMKLGHVFHLDIRQRAAQKCSDEECAFFKEFI